MKESFKVKKVGPDEVDLLTDISLATFTESFYHQNDPLDFKIYIEKALSPQVLEFELMDPKSEFYFLYDATGNLIGYFKINIGINRFEQPAADQMELQRIYIFGKKQSTGAGSYLMEYIAKYAKSLYISTIWLGVWEQNPRAVQFYHKHGFEKVGTHTFLLGNSQQIDYIMERKI